MSNHLSYRLMENAPGPGWYWEIFSSDKFRATRGMAMAEIREVMQSLEVEPEKRIA
jgi:hypothetical protein